MALDEDNLASSLPGPYQIPDEEAFGPARALIHSASAPAPGVPPQSPQIGHHQNPLLDYMNAQVVPCLKLPQNYVQPAVAVLHLKTLLQCCTSFKHPGQFPLSEASKP